MGFMKDCLIKGFLMKEPLIADKVESTMPARCGVTKGDFDILLGNSGGQWTMIGSRRSKHSNSDAFGGRKGTKAIDLANGLDVSRTYHCPICGNRDVVRCGRCHQITCYDKSGYFQCAYCGNSGRVAGNIRRIEVFNSSGLKDGLKQDGMKCCPGDK